ncbi:hypothetical protein Q7P35_010717 [Cladosporium inversicolor]
MGRTKASRRPGATNPEDSKTLSHKPSTTNTNATTNNPHPKSHLTIQERLQDQSLLHWHQPIDEALDLHVHGLLTVTGRLLNPDSWTKWPKNYCRAMLQLVPLVSAPRANELLTAKMAKIGFPSREIGTQPRVVWEVVSDVKKYLEPKYGSAVGGESSRSSSR